MVADAGFGFSGDGLLSVIADGFSEESLQLKVFLRVVLGRMDSRLPVTLLDPALIGVPPPAKFMLEFGIIADVGSLCVIVLRVVGMQSLVFFVAIDGGGTVIAGDIFFEGALLALGLLGFGKTGPLVLGVFG